MNETNNKNKICIKPKQGYGTVCLNCMYFANTYNNYITAETEYFEPDFLGALLKCNSKIVSKKPIESYIHIFNKDQLVDILNHLDNINLYFTMFKSSVDDCIKTKLVFRFNTEENKETVFRYQTSTAIQALQVQEFINKWIEDNKHKINKIKFNLVGEDKDDK